jgi:hypothetical protein
MTTYPKQLERQKAAFEQLSKPLKTKILATGGSRLGSWQIEAVKDSRQVRLLYFTGLRLYRTEKCASVQRANNLITQWEADMKRKDFF